MEHIIELNETVNQLSNEDLLKEFDKPTTIYGRMNLYPVMASRSPKFKDALFKEVLDPKIMEHRVRGSIKLSMMVVLSVFDHSPSDDEKEELVKLIKKNWSREEYDLCVDYLSQSADFAKYFQ